MCRDLLKIHSAVKGKQVAIFIIYAKIIVNMHTSKAIGEKRHMFTAGGKAGLVSAIPAKAGGGSVKSLHCPGEVRKLSLILKGDPDAFFCRIFHKAGKAQPACVRYGRRIHAARKNLDYFASS